MSIHRPIERAGMNDPRWFLIWNETQDRRIRNRDPETHARCKESRAVRLRAIAAIKSKETAQ